jgi:hypothetical protein
MSHRLSPGLVRGARSRCQWAVALVSILSLILTAQLAPATPPLFDKERLAAVGDKDKDKDEKEYPKTDPLKFLDKFGNPQGGDLGLSKDGEFKGKKILVWGNLKGEHHQIFKDVNPMWQALRKRGFAVQLADGDFPRDILPEFDQFWLFSYDQPDNLKEADMKALDKFATAGKGVYLLTDNEPYTVQVNLMAKRWFDAEIKGNYHGTQIGFIKARKLSEAVLAKFNGTFAIAEEDHPLLTGVNFIYEGITISHFAETKKLRVVMRGSDGKTLVGVSNVPGMRVVLDCGYTRYFFDEKNPDTSFINATAGTLRFGENVAAFLQGKEKR